MFRKFAFCLLAVISLLQFVAVEAKAQAVIVPVSTTNIMNPKSRYHRGDVVYVRIHVDNILCVNDHGKMVPHNLGTANNCVVFLSEASTMGHFKVYEGRTMNDGNVIVAYQVPKNPNKDNVFICG